MNIKEKQAYAKGKAEGRYELEYDFKETSKELLLRAEQMYNKGLADGKSLGVADFKKRLTSKKVIDRLKKDKWYCLYVGEIKQALKEAISEAERKEVD